MQVGVRPRAAEMWRLGLTGTMLDLLEEAGFASLDDLARATDEELLAVPGVGQVTLGIIRGVLEREGIGVLRQAQDDIGE